MVILRGGSSFFNIAIKGGLSKIAWKYGRCLGGGGGGH